MKEVKMKPFSTKYVRMKYRKKTRSHAKAKSSIKAIYKRAFRRKDNE